MKILCAYSSLEFSCDHFPLTLHSRESYHPIFNVPQKTLIAQLGKWSGNELTSIDSYLLFLAILRSSDLVDFRVPAIRTPLTDQIIAQNMESLCKIIFRLNTVHSPSTVFPRYVISPETKSLSNVHYWIQNWKNAYQDFLDGYTSAHESQKLIHREAALSRLIRNPHKPLSSYSSQIAEWASIAGGFPEFKLLDPLSPPSRAREITCADYWKHIISLSAREEQIFSIPRKDLEELLEHCEESIPIGSIFSNALFKILRGALERQKNFLGLGDLDIGKSTFEILNDSDSTESANLRAMIQAAPESEPKPEQYPSKFAYIKAKLRWETAKKYTPKPEEDTGENDSEPGEDYV